MDGKKQVGDDLMKPRSKKDSVVGTEKISLSNKHLSCDPKGKERGKILLCIVESIHKGPEARCIYILLCLQN